MAIYQGGVSGIIPRVFSRVFSRVFQDFSDESLQQKDRTWYFSALCWRQPLRKDEGSKNVHSESHAHGKNKNDLTGFTVEAAVIGEVLEGTLS